MTGERQDGAESVRKRTRQELVAALDAGDTAGVRALVKHIAALDAPSPLDLFLMGRAMLLLGDRETAEELLRAALDAARAEQVTDVKGMAAGTLAELLQKTGRTREAVPYFKESLAAKELATGLLAEYSNYLFHLHYLEEPSREELSAVAAGYGELLAGRREFSHEKKRRHAKLRIGYVSGDFKRHIVAFFVWHLLKNYDRANFEVYCYMSGAEDALSEDFKRSVTAWRNVQNATPRAVAQQIYEDGIDVLVDLAGHTGKNLLPAFAYRPAPVQVSMIGYFGTTGVPQMDYVLTDEIVAPRGKLADDACFTERLCRLPVSQLCYMWHDRPPAPAKTPALEKGFVTFGCFQNFAKVSDGTLAAWAEILRRVKNSRLLLKMAVFQDAYGTRLALERLETAGIDLARVDHEATEADYLGAYHRVDLALDTFPYPGGGSTCDALYMGVPVVTLAYPRHGGRFGAGILSYAGHDELVAATAAEYVEKAVALAGDVARLEHYHETLRRDMEKSSVMDGTAYLFAVERAYQQMYAAWLSDGDARKENKARQKALRALSGACRAGRHAEAVRLAGELSGLSRGAADDAAFADEAGMAYLQLLDFPRAAKWLPRAKKRREQHPANYFWLLGMAAAKQKQYVRASQWFTRAELSADREKVPWQEAFVADLFTQHAAAQLALGDIDDGAAANARGGVRAVVPEEEAVRHIGAASHYRAASEKAATLSDRCNMYSSYLVTLAAREMEPAELLKLHGHINDILRGAAQEIPHTRENHAHGKLRVGFLSPDFRQNVMFYFYYQLLAGADKEKFALYAYSRGIERDGFTELVRRAVDVFRDVSQLSYAETAAAIAADGIDVLVDLAGHVVNSGLYVLAWRPAPVQISGLGYMATTGLAAVDYLLTDRICDPEEEPRQISEEPLYLRSLFCYTGRTDVPAPKGAPCRKNGYVTFGIFNRWQKVTDEMLGAWLAIAAQVGKAHFLFKCDAFADPRLADLVYEKLQQKGFPMENVTLEPASADYLARYMDCDIALDTYPYVGGGMTCDALYMGVPVVTRFGATRGTRYARSMLAAAGVGELAAATREEYIEKAVLLARDAELLDTLHKNLRTMLLNSPLMDTRSYVADVYGQLAAAFRNWREG